MKPLTQQAHERLSRQISEGDVVIDATAGNGCDAKFLAAQVGSHGRVFAFDIQRQAIEQAQIDIPAELQQRICFVEGCHSQMRAHIPAKYHGQVAAVMFNLGYLPRGDKLITTTAETTLAALRETSQLLRPGGVVSLVAYPGHPGGIAETAAIVEICSEATAGLTMSEIGEHWPAASENARPSPRLFWGTKVT